jgi:hypothetical protein
MGLVYHPFGVFWQPDALDFVAISLLYSREEDFCKKSLIACYNNNRRIVEVKWDRTRNGWFCSLNGQQRLSRRQLDDQSTDRPYPPIGVEAKDLRPAFLTRSHANEVYAVEFRDSSTTISRRNFIVDYWDTVHGLYDWMEGVVPGGFPIGLPMMGSQ